MTKKKSQNFSVFKSEAGLRIFTDAYERVMEHWPVPYESMEVQTDYGDCHVIACGPKQGKTVLMFHGMTSNSALWYPTIEALSGFRIYCVDTPGDFGKSKAAKKIQTPEDAIRWMNQLLDVMGLEKAIFVGHSMGGWFCSNYAAAHPERIEQLILLAPVASFLPAPFVKLLFKVYPALLFPKPDRIRRAWKWFCAKGYSLPPHIMNLIIAAYMHGKSQLPVVPRVIEKEVWKNLSSPVLFMAGDEEKLYDAGQVKQQVKQALPEATVYIVQGAGHCLMLEQREYVNKVIREFLLEHV
jgi:pimeloyl-ACP methyl ester carboxylesterase